MSSVASPPSLPPEELRRAEHPPSGGGASRRALTELPLAQAISQLAWPSMAAMLLLNVFQLVDAFWVGRLGTQALGGMSASAFFVWCLHSIGMLGGVGITALVSRRVGERRHGAAGVAAGHGLLLASVLGLASTIIGLPLAPTMVAGLGLEGAVAEQALAYLTPILVGMPVITGTYAMEAIFRASGDTRTPMWVLGGTLLLNAVLDPLLIFGYGPVPACGIAGAAWATVIAHAIGLIVGLTIVARRDVRPRLPAVQLSMLWDLTRIGAPIASANFLFCLIYILLTPIIAKQGSAAVAAIGVGHRIEGLAYFTCVGFASAASTLVGQHLGARSPERAERAAWMAAGYATGAVAIMSLLYYAAAPSVFGLFADDPDVISQGTQYLRIVAIFETAMALEVVLEGAFSGAGNSLPPMIVNVPLTALRIPAAYWLGSRMGADGIWWAISISTLLKGLLMAGWFRLARWKHTRV